MLGLCLVAALALGAYAVSSASALEWGKCEFVGSGGNYTGPNCNKAAGEKAKPKGTGSYEWRKASEVAAKREAESKNPNVHFTGASTGKGVLFTGDYSCVREGTTVPTRMTRQQCAEEEGKETDYYAGTAVECEGETNEGEAEGKNRIANVAVTFTGCLLNGSVGCNSAGAAPEEVVVNTLKGKLGWINKAAKEVGVLLEPSAGKHATFAEFSCFHGLIEVVVGVGNKKEGSFYLSGGCIGTCEGATPEEEKHGGYDGIISPITPVNEMTNEFEQKFVTNGTELDPVNLPESFEGKHRESLENYNVSEPGGEYEGGIQWSAAAEEVTNVNEPEEEGEIKA